MGLEYWFPLTSDLHNQGIASLANASVQSGCSLSSDGKLGGCYKNTGTTANVATPISFSAEQFTLCAWVRIDTRTNGWHRAVGLSGSGTYIGMVCENTNGTSVGFHYYKTIDGTNTSIFDTYPCSPTVGAWYHYAMCYDGTRYYVYLNGDKITDAVANKQNIRAEMTTLWLFGGTSNSYVKDSINDVRIYSHCLSPLEIAEIAKGMILHYPMTGGGRGCANLVPGQAKYTSVSPRVLTTTATDGNSWLSGSAFEVKPSTTYTYSVCCDGQIATKHATDGSEPGTFSMWLYLCNDGTTKNWQSGAYDSPVCFTSSNFNHVQVGNRHIWQYTTTATQRYMSIRLNNYGPGTVTNNYWEFKIEESPKFTSYMPNSADTAYTTMGYNTNTEYDTSGYLHNGTTSGVSYSSDSARYSVSTVFDANADTVTVPSVFSVSQTMRELSICIWFKSNTLNSTSPNFFSLGGNAFIRARTSNGQSVWCYYRTSTETAAVTMRSYTFTCKNILDNNWHHLVCTFKDGISKCYIDGSIIGTNDNTSDGLYLMCSSTAWCLAGYSANSENFIGSLSDFRLYATALSAEDIQKLYNTSASLANNGTLMAYEFTEM